jgi:hypothetical protein
MMNEGIPTETGTELHNISVTLLQEKAQKLLEDMETPDALSLLDLFCRLQDVGIDPNNLYRDIRLHVPKDKCIEFVHRAAEGKLGLQDHKLQEAILLRGEVQSLVPPNLPELMCRIRKLGVRVDTRRRSLKWCNALLLTIGRYVNDINSLGVHYSHYKELVGYLASGKAKTHAEALAVHSNEARERLRQLMPEMYRV